MRSGLKQRLLGRGAVRPSGIGLDPHGMGVDRAHPGDFAHDSHRSGQGVAVENCAVELRHAVDHADVVEEQRTRLSSIGGSEAGTHGAGDLRVRARAEICSEDRRGEGHDQQERQREGGAGTHGRFQVSARAGRHRIVSGTLRLAHSHLGMASSVEKLCAKENQS